MNQTLIESLSKRFLEQKKRRAVSFFRGGLYESELSYEELERDSNRFANFLLKRGVIKGDRVINISPKSLLFIVAHIALQKIGAYTVPLNPGFKISELSYLLSNAEPKLVIAGIEQEPLIREVNTHVEFVFVDPQKRYEEIRLFKSESDILNDHRVKPEDAGVIIYTSGTTGKPKGSVMSQANLLHDALTVVRSWEITEMDRFCHALPLYHTHGLSFALHTAFLAGAHILMMDQFNPETVVNILSKDEGKHVCNVFMGVPAMYSKMIEYIGDRNYDFEHMRLWACGSAPLSPKDFWRIKKVFGQEPVEREGMTETGMNFSNPIRGKRKSGSVGLPLPGVQVRIVDTDTFNEKPVGHVGEIWFKSAGITSGYWGKPDETKEAFKDGWFRSGDLGKFDKDGYYYITDRIKHIIISGGENISPKEIDLTISSLDDVVECAVVGIDDDKWGEKVVAAVKKKPDSKLSKNDIKSHCKEHLHDWKCPKEVAFIKSLPRNSMGKILTEEVKKIFT